MKSFIAIIVAIFLGAIVFFYPPFTNPTVTVGVAFSVAPESVIPDGQMVSTIKAYVDWHNLSGRGFRYKLILENFNDDPGEAIGKLKNRGAQVVVGFPFSHQAIKAKEASDRLMIPVLSTMASTTELSGLEDWLFRVKEDFSRETSTIASLMISMDIGSVVGIWSGKNNSYSVGSIKSILSLPVLNLTKIFRFPEDSEAIESYSGQDPEGGLIYANPSVTYWAIQYVRSVWPSSSIFISHWSLFERHHVTKIKNIAFCYTEAFDPFEKISGDFVDYWRSITSHDFSVPIRYSYVAMNFLSDVFKENPSLFGRALRNAMSIPRELSSPGLTVRTDEFGDAFSDIKAYIFYNGSFKEVSP